MTDLAPEPVNRTKTLSSYLAKHKIRRDGWCQECGRWPDQKGGKCRVVEWFDAERARAKRAEERLAGAEAVLTTIANRPGRCHHYSDMSCRQWAPTESERWCDRCIARAALAESEEGA